MTATASAPASARRKAGLSHAQRPCKISTRRDPVTRFARQVLAGKIVAGQHVIGACVRHMRDLEFGFTRGIRFDASRALHAIDFFRHVLKLNGGEFEGVPFELLPWQEFVVGSLFGWLSSGGWRRFRVAYIETAKGSGKSPLAAGVGMYGLVADDESRAEIYAAATKKDQAMILFRDALVMYDYSPHLARRLVGSGTGEHRWNLAYPETGSFYKPISADDGQSGPRPHMALIDEIHEHKNDKVVEMMRAGTKSRRQALILMITNAGAGKLGPCWSYHEYAVKVASGTYTTDDAESAADSFFSFVCSLDEGDDPIRDESCWHKANPSLQHANLPGVKYLREQVNEARGMPSKESLVRRLNFCQWTDSESPWLGPDVWLGAGREYDYRAFAGRRAYAALDLSSTTDLTALVLNIEPKQEGEPWRLVPFAFLPDDDLSGREERDRVPYTAWKRSGHLITTPGRAVSKLEVLKHLIKLTSVFNILLVGYDRWRIEDLKQMAADNDITLPPIRDFGQGFRDMSPAIDKFEEGLLDGSIVHPNHPVLTMCAANAVPVQDAAGNRKLDKQKAIGRIDVIIGAVMAVGISGKAEVAVVPQIIVL